MTVVISKPNEGWGYFQFGHFLALLSYEVLDTEERNHWGTRGRMFPRQLDWKAKRKLRQRYSDSFGRDFIICDGFIVSTVKNENEIISIEEDGYEVQVKKCQGVTKIFTNGRIITPPPVRDANTR